MTLVVLLAVALASCGRSDSGARVEIAAASSLADVLPEIAESFSGAQEGVEIPLDFAGTSTLREQLLEGRAVDVFLSADRASAEAVSDSGQVVTTFARNRLVIAVERGNPLGIVGLADLARDDVLLGVCAAGVPCGDAASAVLGAAGVDAAIDTLEPSVRSVLGKLIAGELDVGLVYATDAAVAGLEAIAISSQEAEVEYVAVTLGDRQLAYEFLAYLTAAPAQEILAAHGFEAP